MLLLRCSILSFFIDIVITGFPCSGGSETAEKLAGTMFYMSFFQGKELFAKRAIFNGEQKEIVDQTAQHLALLLKNHLD